MLRSMVAMGAVAYLLRSRRLPLLPLALWLSGCVCVSSSSVPPSRPSGRPSAHPSSLFVLSPSASRCLSVPLPAPSFSSLCLRQPACRSLSVLLRSVPGCAPGCNAASLSRARPRASWSVSKLRRRVLGGSRYAQAQCGPDDIQHVHSVCCPEVKKSLSFSLSLSMHVCSVGSPNAVLCLRQGLTRCLWLGGRRTRAPTTCPAPARATAPPSSSTSRTPASR